jgi:hypothetical protein
VRILSNLASRPHRYGAEAMSAPDASDPVGAQSENRKWQVTVMNFGLILFAAP